MYLAAYHDMSDPVIRANREDIISRFALRLSNQETSILSLFKYQLFCLLARQVTVEPPVKVNTNL
jgi:hypothetical protein